MERKHPIPIRGEHHSTSEHDPLLTFARDVLDQMAAVQGPIIFLSHSKPDWDSYGALSVMLEQTKAAFPDKTVLAIVADKRNAFRNKPFREFGDPSGMIWENGNLRKYLNTAGLVMMVDNSDWKRARVTDDDLRMLHGRQVPLIILDHHMGTHGQTTHQFIDPTASSASELAARFFGVRRLSKKAAEAAALGLLSDSGELQRLEGRNRKRTEATFAFLAGQAEQNPEDLIKRVEPKFRPAEIPLAKRIEQSRFRLAIPGFPDKVDVFYNPTFDRVPKSIKDSKVAEILLQYHLDHPGPYTFGDEKPGKTLKSIATFDRPEYTVYVSTKRAKSEDMTDLRNKHFPGDIDDYYFEFKMRTNTHFIAANLARRMNRTGGYPGAATGQMYLTPDTQEGLRSGRLHLQDVLQQACGLFAREYADTKKMGR